MLIGQAFASGGGYGWGGAFSEPHRLRKGFKGRFLEGKSSRTRGE